MKYLEKFLSSVTNTLLYYLALRQQAHAQCSCIVRASNWQTMAKSKKSMAQQAYELRAACLMTQSSEPGPVRFVAVHF